MAESDNSPDLAFFDIDRSRAAPGHYYELPVLKEWLPYLAQIALLWGAFEHRRDRFLQKMFTVSKTEPPKGWRGRKGKKRQRLFIEQVDKVFGASPTISAYLHKLANNAFLAQKKRNALLHGSLSLGTGRGNKQWMLWVRDYSNDGSVEETGYSTADLEQLFHELSRLVGAFSPLTSPVFQLQGLSSSDKLLLQPFQEGGSRIAPTPQGHLPPPEASEG